jgi:hypothetical protein
VGCVEVLLGVDAGPSPSLDAGEVGAGISLPESAPSSLAASAQAMSRAGRAKTVNLGSMVYKTLVRGRRKQLLTPGMKNEGAKRAACRCG